MLRIGGQKLSSVIPILVLSDIVFTVVGIALAVFIRFPHSRDGLAYFQGPNIVGRFFLVVLACEVVLYYSDLYNPQSLRSHVEVFVRVVQALGAACVILALLYYVSPELSLGRGIAAMAAPIILMLTFGSRFLLDASGKLLATPDRVLVLGTGPNAVEVVKEIIAHPELNLKVVGFLDERGENIGKSLVNPGIIGAVRDVESIVRNQQIDSVILSLTERRGTMPVSELLHMKFGGVEVEDVHSFIEKVNGRIHLEHLSPSWLILSDGFRKSQFLYAAKRAFDILVAFVAFFLAVPLMVLVAIAIWLETGSPVLFRQERTGYKGRTFRIMKFRSMCHRAEEGGPVWASSDDRRITRVGRFIRKYRLDELPQIINVLKGEMSLVGPRPERPHFCELLEADIPFFSLRHTVRPGITGWAQVKYQYGASVKESKTKLEYDFFYIKHMSMGLDLAILFETAKVMIYGRGAK